MKKPLVILLTLAAITASGMDRLKALSQIESGDNDHAHGRAGEIGRHQITRQVWRQYTSLPCDAATNAITEQSIALKILTDRIARFVAKHGRQPTDIETYKLWNPGSPLETAQRFANLCQSP
jgi:hypothetical protein